MTKSEVAKCLYNRFLTLGLPLSWIELSLTPVPRMYLVKELLDPFVPPVPPLPTTLNVPYLYSDVQELYRCVGCEFVVTGMATGWMIWPLLVLYL